MMVMKPEKLRTEFGDVQVDSNSRCLLTPMPAVFGFVLVPDPNLHHRQAVAQGVFCSL